MINRRKFIQTGFFATVGVYLLPKRSLAGNTEGTVMTINGPISPSKMKFTLTHEHVLVDFIGAEKYSRDRYDADDVFRRALPILKELKSKGCFTFVDCSPAYLGRAVNLFKRLSEATGLNFITNTGYYGAVNEKFVPAHAYNQTAARIAATWIDEFKNGIEGTDIKPGFIKTSVDKTPLTPMQRKLIEAAAITHLDTGIPIAVHTGDGLAADEQLRILAAKNVAPEARIWVHAQNETNKNYHINTAKKGGWVSFDGVSPETIQLYLELLQTMKAEKLLNKVLVSQDSGWYQVGEPNGGNYNHYNTIFTEFIPVLKENGFTEEEIHTIFVANPAKAFTIGVKNLS